MYEREEEERRIVVRVEISQVKCFAHHQLLVVCFFRPGIFRFLRWFRKHSELQMLDDTLALANSCLLACVFAL